MLKIGRERMNKRIGRRIIVLAVALLLSGIFAANSYADSNANADMVWERCSPIASNSSTYYRCAKAVLGLDGGLDINDLRKDSELYNALGGEESRGSYSFSDAKSGLAEEIISVELDREATNCTKDASGWGWFACGLNKTAGGLTSVIYPKVQEYIATDPAIFAASTMETAWNRMRIIADIILVGMIMVMIISQITGLGISNYGIKKSLPRIIVAAIVINLSFFLCRIAIDLANVIGEGIAAVFDGLAASAQAKIDFTAMEDSPSKTMLVSKVAGGLLTGVMAFFATKTALASGQSITLLILVALTSAVIGILLLLTIIQLRKALIILLTITSPVAVLLYILPGTKKTFDRWFGLFKGLLIAYPVCSLMVKGGAFAANIITAAMGISKADGSPNYFTMIIAVSASVIPIFLIPKTIIQSAGALGAKLQGLANKLKGFAANLWRNSAFGQRRDRGAKERANQIRAGVNKNGNETRLGRLTRSHNQRQRLDAAKRAQQDRALRRSEANAPEMARYEEMEQQANATEEMLASISANEMPSKVKDIINSGGSAQDIAAQLSGAIRHWNSVDDKNAADEEIATALDSLDNSEASNAIRREVARKRLVDSDGMLKAKHGAMRQYYKALAGGDYSTEWGNTNHWVEKYLDSNDFNAESMAGIAKPTIGQLENYMKLNTSDPNLNLSADDINRINKHKQQIARTYGDMKQISAFQGATASDYNGLEAAIASYRSPTPPSP